MEPDKKILELFRHDDRVLDDDEFTDRLMKKILVRRVARLSILGVAILISCSILLFLFFSVINDPGKAETITAFAFLGNLEPPLEILIFCPLCFFLINFLAVAES